MNQNILQKGLYEPSFEHDNCGIGAVVDIKGKKSHQIVADALCIVENLEHRAGKDAEGKTGDGVGILTQIPHSFFKKVCKELEPYLFCLEETSISSYDGSDDERVTPSSRYIVRRTYREINPRRNLESLLITNRRTLSY